MAYLVARRHGRLAALIQPSSEHSGQIFTHLSILHPNIQPVQQKVHFPILIEKVVSDLLFSSAFISPASIYHPNLALSLHPRFVTSKMRTKHDLTLKYMANLR